MKVVSQGTGQALDTGRRGDADVVFVHAKAQEEKFVAEGFGVKRFAVMYNDFVLIGPKSDPAGVQGQGHRDGAEDDQGARQRRSSRAATSPARMRPSCAVEGGRHRHRRRDKGPWYREIGQGMGAALNTASSMNGYVLTDRGTWLSFKNRGELDIVVEGDKRLFNQYGVMLVNPAKHPHVKKELGQQFIDWLVSAEGQKAIADYKIDGAAAVLPERDRAGGVSPLRSPAWHDIRTVDILLHRGFWRSPPECRNAFEPPAGADEFGRGMCATKPLRKGGVRLANWRRPEISPGPQSAP